MCVDIAYEDDEAPNGQLPEEDYREIIEDDLRQGNYAIVGVIIR
jgi:hypothetical protein